jgi:hypothetical protein
MESGNSKETRMARLYTADLELLHRKVRKEQVARNRSDVTIAEIVHEQLAQLRLDERAGNT